MKKYLFLLFTVAANTGAFAQFEVRTGYFNAEWEACEKSNAVYYQKVTLLNKLYCLKAGHIDGQVLVEGQFLDYALTEEQDTFITYHTNGVVKEKGAYQAGKKVGVWLGWFEDGQKDFKCTYKADSTHKCAYYHYNGMVSAVEEYRNDTQLISAKLWDSTGANSSNTYIYIPPTLNGYEDGWKRYVDENMNFPKDDQGNRLYGDIRFFILVDKEGNVKWGDVVGFANPYMAFAIERVINKMPKWSPAIRHNRIEPSTLYLKFRFVE